MGELNPSRTRKIKTSIQRRSSFIGFGPVYLVPYIEIVCRAQKNLIFFKNSLFIYINYMEHKHSPERKKKKKKNLTFYRRFFFWKLASESETYF